MAVNLKKNKTELEQAWQEIRDPKSENDWVVFGYDGKTYDLKVVGKGDEGLEEMADEFSSGKIMYGGCRVIDPNTELPKMVFVNWQGEGVPTNVKGVCANHLRDITGFFRGAHVTVNARCEDDLDPDAVKDKVKKSSGANFSYHKEKPRPEPANKPVKSVYQRIIPEAEIDIKTRDKFWSQQEKDEQQRVKEETARQAKEREEMEKKRRERETQEAKKREAFIRERSKSIEEQRALHKKELQRKKDDEKQRYQETMKEMQRDDEEFRHRSDSLRKQRLQEVGKLIKARKESFDEGSPREVFDKPAHKKPPPPVAAKKKKQPPPPVAKKTPRQENESIRKPPVALPVTRNEPKPEPEPEPFAKPKPLPEPVARYEPEPEPEPEPQPQIQEPESVFPHREPEPKIPPRVHEPEPPRRELTPEPEMPEEENLYDTIEDEPSPAPAAPPVPVHSQEPESVYEPEPSFEPQPSYQPEPATHVQQEQYEEDNLYETVEDTIPEEPPQEPAEPVQQDHYYSTLEGDQSQVEAQITPLASQGIIARAIYDYQAEDEGEITFDPGDIITNIDTFDEGWWKGQAPDGRYGMFPANYVEIIESDQDSLFDVDVSFSTKESIHWGGLFIMQQDHQQQVVDNYQYEEQHQQQPHEVEQPAESYGLSARALYDYQAEDESEITFDPGDIITNIEQIDEGWWRGTGPDGRFGLFPANYVELIA